MMGELQQLSNYFVEEKLQELWIKYLYREEVNLKKVLESKML